MVARLSGLSHRSSIHSVVIKGNSAWMPTAIPAASPRVTSNPNTSAMIQRRIRMTGDPYAARRLISQTEVVPPFDGALHSEIHRSSSRMHPKVKARSRVFRSAAASRKTPSEQRTGPRFGRAAKTLLRQSYPIRGMAVAENKPLVPIVRHDDARHDSAEARPRTSQAEAGRMKS